MRNRLVQWATPYNVLSAVLILLAVGIFLYNCRHLWAFTIDDSFITFRYSANLVNGIGPTFNSLPPRAEGYTSFLWMIIMVFPHLLNFGVVSFSKLIGILSVLGAMALMYMFIKDAAGKETEVAKVAGGVAILFLAALPETAVHAVSGMETAPYAFSLLALAYLAFKAIGGATWALKWLPAVALVNGLLRPEANILALIIVLIALTFAANKRQFLLRTLMFYVLPGALYFAWRWLYYSVLLPLPFYIKAEWVGLPGGTYVQSFLIFVFVNFFLLLGFSLFGNRRALLPLFVVAIADLVFFLFVSPVMGYDFRFLYPLLPLMMVLAGIGLLSILRLPTKLVQGERGRFVAAAWISSMVLILFAWNNLPRVQPLFEHKLAYASGLQSNHLQIGTLLSQIEHTGASPLLVVTDAGMIPYYAGWATIDALGLNDANIALGRVDTVDYVFSHSPDVLILASNDLDTFTSDSVLYNSLFRAAIDYGMAVLVRRPAYQGDSIWVMGIPGSEPAMAFAEWAEADR